MKKDELKSKEKEKPAVKVKSIQNLDSIQTIKSKLNSLINQYTPVSETPHNPPAAIFNHNNVDVMQFLAELNEEAVQLINAESFDDALSALSQAEEKISTLKNIEPNEETYIITVFYNIACCHQKLGELQK